MSTPIHRSLRPSTYCTLRGEVMRAAVELSDEQLIDLTEALHGMLRLRRPGRPISDPGGWVEPGKPIF